MIGIPGRTEQPGLLQGHRHEQQAALGARRTGKMSGQGQYSGRARRIVQRAVADIVTARIGLAAADMIPVRGHQHYLVRTLRSGQQADDIVRNRPFHRVVERQRARQAGGDGAEVGPGCGLFQPGQIMAGAGQHTRRGLPRDPALILQHRLRRAALIQAQRWPPDAGTDHAPRIAGRFIIIDDQRRSRALAQRFLIFVGIAAIIGDRAAVERPGGLAHRRRPPVRIIDQHQHRLAAHIDAGVIVPAPLRRDDAVADEDDVRRVHAHLALRQPGSCGHIAVHRQRDRLSSARNTQLRGRISGDRNQRHRLQPFPVIAGLQANGSHALCQIGDGLGLTGRGRRAAFKRV